MLRGAELEPTAPVRPLVVALHGAAVNSAVWLPLQRDLGDEIEVIAPDLPGHGTRSDTTFTLEAAQKVIDEILADVPEQRPVVLVGDSLGGYLALLAGSRAGARVQAVVAGGASYDMRGFAGALTRLTEIPTDIIHFFAGEEPVTKLLTFAVKRMTDAATADAIITRGLRPQARHESIAALRTVDIGAATGACKGRVYVVNGGLDIPTVWFTRDIARRAKDGYAVVIPWTLHGCAILRPAEFADIVAYRSRSGAQRSRTAPCIRQDLREPTLPS